MAERSHEEVERDAKDTDELLYTDLSDNIRGFGLDHLPLKPDHCDLLLDAIDAQLGQLQVQPQKHPALSRGCDCSNAAPLGWSRCPSKDTGLGSTKQTNDTPTSCLDLIHTQRIRQKSERSTSCQEHTAMHVETKMRSEKEIESRREQVIWRLERLLGDTCNKDGIAGEMHPPSESICTEDFVRRFREEMVELAFPENNMQQLDKEKESEKTEVSDSDTYYNVPAVETAYYSQANTPDQRNEPYFSEKAGAGEKYQSSQRADAGNTSHKTEVVTEPERLQHNNSHSPKSRCLPGVHVRRFDSVSIDSDLDSVCTEQSRQHIHRQPGWHALIRSVTGIDGNCTDQSGCDTPAQEESGPPSTSVQRHTHGNLQNRSPSAHKAQSIKRKTYRLVYSLDENDQNGNEKMNHWTRRCRSQRTSEKMQLDRAKLKERLFNLQQKCEREEEALRLKRTQLKGVELSLSELQQKRKYTLQELEQLTAETAQMEKKKRILETFLSDSQAEKDSISCQLEKLQRKRESCLLEVRNMEEELATLSQRKAALKDRSYMEKNSVVMSVLEREEMERQLDSSKTALFAEQRRAREKLEFMQEKLEETCEELHRATEAENTLRNRCVWLEEKQMQKKMEIEALEVQVSKLQAELGESKIRVGTLEKIFAQKERQLIDFQEHRKASQAERDGLKQELQHLKSQLYKSVEEAQEQAHRMMVNAEAFAGSSNSTFFNRSYIIIYHSHASLFL
uniref:trichohyalin-like n=1 Tax=Monopterus albus TaxID=43700 RepID=UPI0009B39C2A|nr:trichohyalin-like [Monopterus albus]